MKTTTTTTTARIYVGTYAKYNDGSIAGAWLDLQDYDDVEEFYTACADLHKDEEDPEYMFQDYEGFPECYYSESSADSALWSEYFPACDQYGQEVVDAFLSIWSPEDLQHLGDSYQGEYSSPADYAESFCSECYNLTGVPSSLLACIDWDQVFEQMGATYQNGHVFTDF